MNTDIRSMVIESVKKQHTLGSKFSAYKEQDVVIISCNCGNKHPVTLDFIKNVQNEKSKTEKTNEIIFERTQLASVDDGDLFIKTLSGKKYMCIKVTSTTYIYFPYVHTKQNENTTSTCNFSPNEILDKILFIDEEQLNLHVPGFYKKLFKHLTVKQLKTKLTKLMKENKNETK